MLYMNEGEIDQGVARHSSHPVLGPATRFLADFRDVVNAHSDGWAYWKAAGRAAGRLMALIQSPATADAAALTKALVPIKSLCTRRKLPCPTLAKPPR